MSCREDVCYDKHVDLMSKACGVVDLHPRVLRISCGPKRARSPIKSVAQSCCAVSVKVGTLGEGTGGNLLRVDLDQTSATW